MSKGDKNDNSLARKIKSHVEGCHKHTFAVSIIDGHVFLMGEQGVLSFMEAEAKHVIIHELLKKLAEDHGTKSGDGDGDARLKYSARWLRLSILIYFSISQFVIQYLYRVYPSNKQKQNWKIDTSLVAIGAQNLFFSLYKLGVNFLWIREILKMYISPSFSNRKKVQYYRFCIFKGVSKLDLLHSTGHKSLKNGSKSNNLGSLIKFRKFLAR